MNQLIPAILAPDEKTFRERLTLVERDFPIIQIDVMDSMFVPNRSWFDAKVIASIKTPTSFELHLMVTDPARYIEQAQAIPSITRLIWHIETTVNHDELIDRCHTYGKQAGLAISPTTQIDRLNMYTDKLDEILVMGAEPGFSGQSLQPQTIERAREIHTRWPSIPVGFDINVNRETIPALKQAGISRFCAASAIFNSADPKKEAASLRSLL